MTRHLRRAAGYTQQELAAADVSRRMIVYYEAQEQPPLAEVIARLAPLLATNADELLGLVAPRKAPSALDARVVRRLRAIEQLAPAKSANCSNRSMPLSSKAS